MDSFETMLDNYITILLTIGVNLQPDQTLVVGTPGRGVNLEIAGFVRSLAGKAYELGARDVRIEWDDPDLLRLRLAQAPEATLTETPTWKVKEFEELIAGNAALLAPYAPTPDLLSDVDPQRVGLFEKTTRAAFKSISEAIGSMKVAWTIGAVVTPTWARRVFPDLPEAEAVERLWGYVFKAVHADTPDPVAAWREHLRQLAARVNFMNTARFAKLHYVAPGTALTIELPARHQWIAGSTTNAHGTTFVPNMPTEEIFTLPHRDGVSGTVRSTMPLNANGVTVEGISLTFDRGRIVEYSADAGYETLKEIIETDDGAHYLGEVALVPNESAVNFGIPLYNTLFDENAACHLAIGRAYPFSLEGGDQMTPEQLAAAGVNTSLQHVDFMVGSPALHIDGETASGERVPVFRDGTWTPNVLAG